MRTSVIFAVVGLAVLIPITVMATLDVGFVGIFAVGWESWAGAQVFVDLVLACSISLFFLTKDMKQRGLPAWPLVVATVALGSLALLGWVLIRAFLPVSPAASTSGAPAR